MIAISEGVSYKHCYSPLNRAFLFKVNVILLIATQQSHLVIGGFQSLNIVISQNVLYFAIGELSLYYQILIANVANLKKQKKID
ncbi:hypothetical protein NGB78_03310 [Staphylococcus arlettae]|uniref:Uncharacterized protein n=2 Tax=Staphylococcus arlettae TaxID=29378 RepID=A0A2T7BXA1_9STAP|nr:MULTISPECIES: hypothetical protein [Staphylococcus]ERF47925.1 hypothetical protein N039_06800 [Staphylococcus sp. EGD-HP3]KAB2478496.1 hypothetical protein F9B39_08570 [Staphylococcus sp. CH99b_3]MBF0738401.1 hypothetical protein [Staphylococcus arlettae]MCD8816736.1 hypothetical protein [Staphylococcus arlettae]MCD8833668.1 hypothetical protein [Staphylococcus arlettae]